MASVVEPSSAQPRKTPFLAPLPDCKPAPKPELTADQQTKYEALLEKAKEFDQITCPKEADKSGPITDSERAWLTKECLLRYLRATKWSVPDATTRLLATLAWRREYGIEGFTPDYISPEQETGKQMIVGFDKQGRPAQYLNPWRQNTDASPRQINHLFYMVERVVEMMPPDVEQLSLMINFKTTKQRSNTSVPIATAREVLYVLQNHYPERLGKALIINVPWIVKGFFTIITPFIDPVTREKLKFNEDMTQYLPPAQLWSEDWGGKMDFDYDHETYWASLNELCRLRREERLRRWEAGGKVIGESESYLQGGTDTSVAGLKYEGEKVGWGESGVDAVTEKLGETKLDEDEKVKEAEATPAASTAA
ncbi:CRAL/TRIO domain-containing protein [Sarocladium strictum]